METRTEEGQELARDCADRIGSTALTATATCSARSATTRGNPAAAAASGCLTRLTKAEMILSYDVRACDGCGATDAEAREAELGFWIYAGGASCGACLGADA